LDHFYQPKITFGNLYLDSEESKHCIRVLRKRVGDKISIFDGNGGTYICRLTNPNPKKAEFEILEKYYIEKPKNLIHIAIAPTKNIERIEWFLEKSIEVGIQIISFVQCVKSERKKVKMERMIRKAINAMKQSKNPYLPIINDIVSLKDFIMNVDTHADKFICHESMGQGHYILHEATQGSNYKVIIGPEGDFTKDELQLAEKYKFLPVSLGETRLRTETAGVVACTLLNALNTEY